MIGLPMENPDPGYTNVWHTGTGYNHLPHPTATFSNVRGCSLTRCGLLDVKHRTLVIESESWARLCPRCLRLRDVPNGT